MQVLQANALVARACLRALCETLACERFCCRGRRDQTNKARGRAMWSSQRGRCTTTARQRARAVQGRVENQRIASRCFYFTARRSPSSTDTGGFHPSSVRDLEMSTCSEPQSRCAMSRLPRMAAAAISTDFGTGSKRAGRSMARAIR